MTIAYDSVDAKLHERSERVFRILAGLFLGTLAMLNILGVASGYIFKLIAAMLDTIPFYIGVPYLSRYLRIDPSREHAGWESPE